MTLPRNIEDSARLVRAAAVEKLRKEHGMTVSRFRQSAPEIAKLIMQVEPKLSGSPDAVIRAWLGLKPEQAAGPKRLTSTGRPYRLAQQMQVAAARARACQPPMMCMSSSVRAYEGIRQ